MLWLTYINNNNNKNNDDDDDNNNNIANADFANNLMRQ